MKTINDRFQKLEADVLDIISQPYTKRDLRFTYISGYADCYKAISEAIKQEDVRRGLQDVKLDITLTLLHGLHELKTPEVKQ
jgi:hypothetical protein